MECSIRSIKSLKACVSLLIFDINFPFWWSVHWCKWCVNGNSLKKLGTKLPYYPAMPLLGIYLEEAKVEKDTGTPMFIAALFTIARTWKQPRSPLTDEWIKKLWYIYTMEYYSAIKRNTFESVLMRWMHLEALIQSEVRKRKTNIVY